jgi:hypothetical protein
MDIKTTDDYSDERLHLLMEAVGNDRLDGEVCPHCFEEYSQLAFPRISASLLNPRKVDNIKKGKIREALNRMKELKNDAILQTRGEPGELIKEYTCSRCGRSYVGELNLIANLSDTRVLSFFGYDETRSYKKDFYCFSVIDDSYDSFIQELWDQEVEPTLDEPTITPLMVRETTEDAITGEVLGMLKRFFIKFSKEVYSDIGATVKVYTSYQAGTVESGRRLGVAASGADSAIWVGPLTREHAQLIDDYVNEIPGSKLPIIVGNGVIFQAKKENGGKIDRKQIDDLVNYASIVHKGHEYFGVPGKLFMNYSTQAPYVTVLSCDYTYNLYKHSNQLPPNQQFISFPTSLKTLSEHTHPIGLPAFVQSYLSGKIGTPLLMLQDIFATPGPKLIVGLPPELLRTPSSTGQPLSGVLDDWIEVLEKTLEANDTPEEFLQMQGLTEAEQLAKAKIEKERTQVQWQEKYELQLDEILEGQDQQQDDERYLTH